MISSAAASRRPTRAAWVAVLPLVALVLAGCGGSSATPKPKPSTPTLSPQTAVPVPDGVTLTEYGSKLKFGESARVAYAPNEKRKSVLELTVLGVSKGSIDDLASYALEDRTRESTPYYVRVRVENVGEGDVGQSPVPLFLVDNRDTLISASSFTNTFTRCPSPPLPTTFAPQAKLTTCLVYLAPDHGRLTGISFRAVQEFAPIVWTGAVKVLRTTKKAS